MARFVSTTGISSSIEQIIKNSKKKLTLISPYLNPSDYFYRMLAEAEKRKVKVTLVYGKDRQLKPEVEKKLFSYKNLQIYFYLNLHAKCYFNESILLITSMNLLNYSEKHNREMGVFIEKDKDLKIFNDAIKESILIIKQSVLRKSFGNDTVSMHEHLIKEDINYKEYWNYHLPSLKEIFIEIYPKYKDKISIERELKIEDFPSKGINLEISNKVCVIPRDKEDYIKIRKINEGQIETYLPNYRFWWLKTQIDIYAEENYRLVKNKKGLKIHLRKMFFIIETLHEHLKTQID